MDAESPVVVMDEPAIGFNHHGNGGWKPVDLDMYYLAGATESSMTGLGEICPPCAFIADGQCHDCPPPEHPAYPSSRPECRGCEGHEPIKVPWYKREDIMVPLVTSIVISTAAGVLSAIILKRTGYQG